MKFNRFDFLEINLFYLPLVCSIIWWFNHTNHIVFPWCTSMIISVCCKARY